MERKTENIERVFRILKRVRDGEVAAEMSSSEFRTFMSKASVIADWNNAHGDHMDMIAWSIEFDVCADMVDGLFENGQFIDEPAKQDLLSTLERGIEVAAGFPFLQRRAKQLSAKARAIPVSGADA